VATSARQLTLIRRWGFELQQLVQGGGARLVESRSQGRLYRFQIGPAVLAALGKDTAEQLVYLPRHLLMDRSSRFFSCSVQPPRWCSAGRSRQILSLRATRSWPSFWKRWNSVTSCWALRRAVGLGKVSVTVLPATRRVRRNCGSCPGSLCLAQWQDGLPQRRMTAVREPGRRSPKLRNSSRSLDLLVSKVSTSSGIRIPFCTADCLSVYRRTETCHKKRNPARWHLHVAHPFERSRMECGVIGLEIWQMRRAFRHICATEVVVMCWPGAPPGKSQCPGLSTRHQSRRI